MKKIIAATDFSVSGTNAVKYAAQLADFLKADLVLFHAFQLQVTYNEASVVEDPLLIQQTIEKEMAQLKDSLTGETSGRIHIDFEVHQGLFFEELKGLCERAKPYTVVMGSQGTTATDRFFFGGHTIHAMKNLSWPLITVPEGTKFKPFRRIGLACDFDHVTDTIPADELGVLVRDFEAKLFVLNTAKKKEFKPEMIYESGLVQEMLMGLNPIYHFITSTEVDQGIMEFSEKNEIDLLIVLPKHHSIPEKLMHKSHTKQFVLYSPIPVMALHQ
ncbi:MAG: universal stress protein [Bacteroidota bacterium]|nr:universal stress protein [Bacteroidota bacterium]